MITESSSVYDEEISQEFEQDIKRVLGIKRHVVAVNSGMAAKFCGIQSIFIPGLNFVCSPSLDFDLHSALSLFDKKHTEGKLDKHLNLKPWSTNELGIVSDYGGIPADYKNIENHNFFIHNGSMSINVKSGRESTFNKGLISFCSLDDYPALAPAGGGIIMCDDLHYEKLRNVSNGCSKLHWGFQCKMTKMQAKSGIKALLDYENVIDKSIHLFKRLSDELQKVNFVPGQNSLFYPIQTNYFDQTVKAFQQSNIEIRVNEKYETIFLPCLNLANTYEIEDNIIAKIQEVANHDFAVSVE